MVRATNRRSAIADRQSNGYNVSDIAWTKVVLDTHSVRAAQLLLFRDRGEQSSRPDLNAAIKYIYHVPIECLNCVRVFFRTAVYVVSLGLVLHSGPTKRRAYLTCALKHRTTVVGLVD